MLVLLAAAAAMLPAIAAGAAILALYLAFNILSGIGSLAFQDVVGKTIPKGRRGRMLSNRAMIGGALTLAAAAVLKFAVEDPERISMLLTLVLVAAVLWAAGASLFALITEEKGETGGGRTLLDELAAAKSLYRKAPGYRRYLNARGLLLLGVELAMPFFVLDAIARFGESTGLLALFIFSVGIANIVSSPFWGTRSDDSSRKVMAAAGAIGAAAAGIAFAFGTLPQGLQHPWLYAALLFGLGIAQAGVRLGRKTWLVDSAPEDERPLYVAFSNTAAGVIALAGGLLGVVAELISVEIVLAALAVLSILGALVSIRLPGATRESER